MDITYLGHSSFKLKGKSATVVTDPFDPAFVGIKFPTTEADIVCVSHQHADHNYLQGVANAKKVIDAPGEYEVMGVSFLGFPSYHDDKKGELRGKNTIFVIEIDGFRIAHLGDLGHVLSDQLIEEMGSIDILLIPTGGVYTIDSEVAAKVAQDIDAPIVVPMHYKSEGLSQSAFGMLEEVSEFVKAYAMPVETLDKLSIKKSDVAEERKIVIFNRK
ncbi:MAG: MBL fold metallo-hydrolase [Patescibacteria group bacterium]|nr:MBL fold metallo-hydrolase [Patescibacteria group bacterium]